MEQPSLCSLLPVNSRNDINPRKKCLGITMMLIGYATFVASQAQAATIGFTEPNRSGPTGTFTRYISSPDSAILHFSVRLAAGSERWQGSCTIKGNLVAERKAGRLPNGAISLGAIEGLHYRFLSSTSFSLTTIPALDGSESFETVEQDIVFEAIQSPFVQNNVRVAFRIANLDAKCGTTDVTADVVLANYSHYGGNIIIEDSFYQPSLTTKGGIPRLLAAVTSSNLATGTKI